jgi:hypothetical protein
MPMNPRLLVPRATFDPDAAAYLRAVEAADGQALETPVKRAVDNFFKGIKADGTFSALKAACLLCGARTLAGALVPLAGDAPTNNNFVDADYNRETGLKGNGSTKYLDSNRAATESASEDTHLSVYISSAATGSNQAHAGYITNAISPSDPAWSYQFIWRDSTSNAIFFYLGSTTFYSAAGSATGFSGLSSSSVSSFTTRLNGLQKVGSFTQSTYPTDYFIFARNNTPGPASFSDARLAFYSIGEALDLEALDDRVSALVTAIGAAI